MTEDHAFSEKWNLKLRRYKIEIEQRWEEEIAHIPFIKFPADWEIQITPPFRDAVVRFRVRLPSGMEKSVYLDSRQSLGIWSGPYWEVYPVQDDDIARCDRDDIKTLLELIAYEEEAPKSIKE